MELLRNIFGLTSGIIRLAVAVGIIAAVYFFLLKPVLHSADNAVDKANTSFEHSFEKSGIDHIGKTIEHVNHQVQVQIERSFHVAKVHGNPKKLIRCIRKADGEVHRIQQCTRKF
jgi:hypothetical protein